MIAGNGPFPTFTCGIGIQMENRKIPRLMSRICTVLGIIVALWSFFKYGGFFINPIESWEVFLLVLFNKQ